MIMLMTMMGGGMGALILVPFTSGAGNDVFNAAWIGIGGTVLSLLLVCRLVTEPARGSKDASRGEMQVRRAGLCGLQSRQYQDIG